MQPTFRTLALTAALSALAPAAFAAQVELNFDQEFGAVTQPVAVDAIRGLQFSGAFGYGAGMVNDREDPDFLASASADRGGFILNKQRGQSTTDIIITLVRNAAGNTARNAAAGPVDVFQSITFNLFTQGTGSSNKLIATGANGEDIRPLTSGGSDRWTPSPITYTFDPLNQITSLRFTAGGAPLALDDMTATVVVGTDPGGNVPEPASYGLVGLALLAAGAAGRRNQRG